MLTFVEFLVEVRDMDATIKHLQSVADRPGSSAEGRNATAAILRLKGSDDGRHPLHDVAAKFGYETTVTNHYKHPKTGHSLHLYDKQHDPADMNRHSWEHSHPRGATYRQYNPEEKLSTSLHAHLKSTYEPKDNRYKGF